MAFLKNCWFYIIVVLCTFKLCISFTFEIKRSKSVHDVIPNNIGINSQGRWIELGQCRADCANSTTGLNTGQCKDRCCKCACPWHSSTFSMGATAQSSSCVRNKVLRSMAGCEIFFQSESSINVPLLTLNLNKSDGHGNEYVVKPPNGMNYYKCRCYIMGIAQYWDSGMWKNVAETDLFRVYTTGNSDQNYFEWKENDNYEGRIMRQALQCNNTSQGKSKTSCIIFKVSGSLQYSINDSPNPTMKTSQQPPTTKARATRPKTTRKTTRPKTTRPKTTRPKTTRPNTTRPNTTRPNTTRPKTTRPKTTRPNTTTKTTRPSTRQITSKVVTTTSSGWSTTVTHPTDVTTTNKDETSTASTHQTSTTSETPYTTKYTHDTATTTTTEKIPTEASEMPVTITTKVIEQSTTQGDVAPGEKGARGASGGSDGSDNTLLMVAIGAVAAIICVTIICVFLWLKMKRRNNRSNEACSTDMTVITNGTGMNNSASAPTLKNPIYDNAGYSEPTEKHHPSYPKKLPMLGNPAYDKAIINSNSKRPQNIKNPSHKPKNAKDSNFNDKKNDEEMYDNPGYQELVTIRPVKNSANYVDCSDSTYDNMYAEPEKPVYEELSKDAAGRDSIYQPLVHNSQGTETVEAPEYLTLIGENTRQEEQSPPEYLTLIDDENNQTQPESYDYDYAFVDGEERPTNVKAPNTKGASMSQHGPPLYDVLEDPNDKGPPVYDVLEDPNDEGPPVYDALEDPNDKGPPVYDVLEGPDSGDDYLVPVDGIHPK